MRNNMVSTTKHNLVEIKEKRLLEKMVANTTILLILGFIKEIFNLSIRNFLFAIPYTSGLFVLLISVVVFYHLENKKIIKISK